MSQEIRQAEPIQSDRALCPENKSDNEEQFPCFYEPKHQSHKVISAFKHRKVKEFNGWRKNTNEDEDKLKYSQNATTMDDRLQKRLCFRCEEVLHEGECRSKQIEFIIPQNPTTEELQSQPLPSEENSIKKPLQQCACEQIPEPKINSNNCPPISMYQAYSKIKQRDERQKTWIHSLFCSFCYTLEQIPFVGSVLKLLFKTLLLPYAVCLLSLLVFMVILWMMSLIMLVPVIGWCYWSCFYVWSRGKLWQIACLIVFFPVTYPLGVVLGLRHECKNNGSWGLLVQPVKRNLIREIKSIFCW